MKNFYLSLLLAILFVADVNAQQCAPFKQGDRVVFMGNSITDGGHYHSYIWLYYLTRFPSRRMEFYNAGIGGDVAGQMYDRLETDVFARKPTVMTLTFGMNDTGYQLLSGKKADSAYNARIAESLRNFRLIEAKLKQHPALRKIMIGSSPYDQTSGIKMTNLAGKNQALRQIAAVQQQTAKANNWDFVDFGAPMTAISLREQRRDSLFSFQNGDRIHPTNDGQMVMAWAFLQAQGFAGKKVAAVNIDAAHSKVVSSENCLITAPSISPNQVVFTYKANALPYPVDTVPTGWGKPQRSQAQALPLIPFTSDFNEEVLQIAALKAGKYQLKIDSQIVGSWDATEYSKGINLATITTTPQYQQALAVMQLNEERWAVERRLREYYWLQYSLLQPKGLLFKDDLATVDSVRKYGKKDFFVASTFPTYQKARFKEVRDTWQQEIELLINRLYIINKPVAHRFEIKLIN